MISNEKISIRAKSEDEAINKAYQTLREQNKYNVVINKLIPRFDGVSEVYEISYSYENLDKNSHLEIERKFLLDRDSNFDNYNYSVINQSYIGFRPVSRVRKIDNKYYYNQKGEGTLVREESEKEINEDTYNKLIDYKIGRTIVKHRYKVPVGKYLAEVDKYLGDLEGLLVVEVEFNSLEEANNFEVPNWFGKEITEDLRYKNDNLAIATKEEVGELLKDTGVIHLSK